MRCNGVEVVVVAVVVWISGLQPLMLHKNLMNEALKHALCAVS